MSPNDRKLSWLWAISFGALLALMVFMARLTTEGTWLHEHLMK